MLINGKNVEISKGADLQGADLQGANLYGADLQGANLRGADLRGADLRRANLYGANLRGANLQGVNLQGANLYEADLQGANLYRADLQGANLYGANLYGANLYGANLYGANLHGADLRGADLQGANLYEANLQGVNLQGAEGVDLIIAQSRILPEGDIIGWKKCERNVIVKLLIPADAKRSHAFGRKCRAEFVKVLEVIGAEEEAVSQHDGLTKYRAGNTVKCDSWSTNWQDECAGGIHFYITRLEAECH